MSPLLLAIVGAVALVLLIVMVVLSRIRVAGPNEAFIVTGRKGRAIRGADGSPVADLSGQKVVMGASVFVLPVVQRLYRLDLSSREIPVQVDAAVSAQGIRCDADAVAIVKVGGTAEMIRPAAQRFLHQQDRIEAFTGQVLSGALRAVIGRLTVEEIIRDRAAFAAQVAEEAERSLTHQGLVLDAFQLEDIRTAGTYLEDLGRPEAARVLRAAAAGPLAEAERRQAILTEQQRVAERNAELKERVLDTEVRKPADAARYKTEQEAEAARNAAVFRADAERQTTIAAAQAQAEQVRLMGEGQRAQRMALAEAAAIEGAKQGEAEQRRRTAIADAVEREGAAEASAIQARGHAEAEAVKARGQAEAEAMQAKAEAFARYGEAAVLDLLARMLPQVVAAASAPMSAVDKMTVISTDGASALTRSVASNVTQGLQLGSDLTGIDLATLLARLGNAAAPIAGPDADGKTAEKPVKAIGTDGRRDSQPAT